MMILTRRNFLAATTVASASGAPRKMIRLGGPVFLKSEDPREAEDTARTREIEKAFAAEDVVIAEVGAWRNMLDPDPEKRRANLNYVTAHLALAEAVGARCAVDIAGSYNPDVWYGPHPKNFSREFFDATVENCRKVIDQVKPRRAKFAIEMMGWALPSNPDEYERLLKAVDRRAFAVHLDVCNIINSPVRFYYNADVIRECFQKLGRWIVSCHAKDLKWEIEMNVHFREVIPGTGQIDYRTYLTELAKLPADVPLMLEHLKGAGQYAQGAGYIRKVARQAGVSLL